MPKTREELFEEGSAFLGEEAATRVLSSLGLMPGQTFKQKTYPCPKCGQPNAYYKEIHPDTDMNDIVLRCPDCGFLDEK